MFISDSQSKDIFKISFNIQYKDINILEEFFTEKVSATSVYEIKSKTLESQSEDIWCFEIYCDDEINLIALKKEVQELGGVDVIVTYYAPR